MIKVNGGRIDVFAYSCIHVFMYLCIYDNVSLIPLVIRKYYLSIINYQLSIINYHSFLLLITSLR